MSAGITPPFSLLRAHAPIRDPPHASELTSYTRSLQVAVSPCWESDLPDVISANLSPRAWTPTPAALVVHLPVSSHKTTAFPTLGPGRRDRSRDHGTYPYSNFSTELFTRLQSFTHVQARGFARHPDCSYRSGSLSRSPAKVRRVRWVFHRFRSGPQSDSHSPSHDSGNPPGSRGFYFRAYLSSLPPRAADMLTVRFGQLTVEGLSPSKIRSLVGCSPNVTANPSQPLFGWLRCLAAG